MSSETLTISALLGGGRFEQPFGECAVWRYYDPASGQFLTVDPLVDQTQQAYAYVEDDPVGVSDPTGRCSSTPLGLKTSMHHAARMLAASVNPSPAGIAGLNLGLGLGNSDQAQAGPPCRVLLHLANGWQTGARFTGAARAEVICPDATSIWGAISVINQWSPEQGPITGDFIVLAIEHVFSRPPAGGWVTSTITGGAEIHGKAEEYGSSVAFNIYTGETVGGRRPPAL